MIYPIPTYVSNCQKWPKLLAVNIPYLNLFLKIYIFQPAPEGRTETSQLTFVPKSWHDISNTNIYLQLLKLSQTVGCEYLICTSSKMYISQPHARWLQRNSPTYILLPRVGMIYPIQTCIYNWYVFPKQLAAHIQYKFVFPSSLNCVHYLYSLYVACMSPVCPPVCPTYAPFQNNILPIYPPSPPIYIPFVLLTEP